jgi:glucose-1-phosphate thymidylyltransferase
MKCLILAGGFATRLYPLTLDKAKALLEFKGKPVITHVVNRVPEHIDILVSTNKKFESDFLDWQKELGRTVDICIEESVSNEQKKGAVGAIDYWIKYKNINEDLIIIAADNYFELDIMAFITSFNGQNAILAVHDVGNKDKACDLARACQVGLVITDGKKIIRFDEKPIEATSSIIATGIYLLPSRIFPLLSQYCKDSRRDNMGDFISYLLAKEEEVHAYVFTETWVDIGEELKKIH